MTILKIERVQNQGEPNASHETWDNFEDIGHIGVQTSAAVHLVV